jgi:hypothetical protein
MAVGDFNGDGKLDVVAASDCLSNQDCSTGSMVILLGNGDGTLTGTGVSYPLGGIVSQANTITVGDLNRDGKADVVVTLACDFTNVCAQGDVEVYMGNGDGSLQSPNRYPTTGNSGIPVAIGDFNNDGKPDVVVATPGSTVTFFPGNGDGTLASPSTISIPIGGEAIAVADFNSDGNLDIALAGNLGPGVILNGNGDGTFQAPISLPTGLGNAVTDGASIAIGDLSGDGKPDLVLSGTLDGFNGIAVFLNDGAGNFIAGGTYTAGGWLYAPLVAADFNSDGKDDIVLASGLSGNGLHVTGSDGTISVLLGNGDGTLRSARYIDESTSAGNVTTGLSVAAADFNGDGFQDLIYQACSATINSTCGFTLLLADGAGSYQPPVLFTAPVSGSRFLAVADFNRDGKPDVAAFNDCNASCAGSSVSVFLNAGNGNFQDAVVYEGGDVVPLAIATGDFNGDGKPDIAILHYCGTCGDGQDSIAILLGNGDGSLQPVVTTLTGSSNAVNWLAAADFNGDGKSDLVLAENTNNPSNPYEGSAQILISNGDGTFAFGALYDSGGGRSSNAGGAVTTGDVNGDGKADIVVGNLCDSIVGDANCTRGTIGVLLGNGDGTFQSVLSQAVPDANMYAISMADVNADGKLDVVTSTGTGIAVFFGNGDGSFRPPTVYAALEVIQNVQLAIADLNGDGGPDIVQPGVNGQLAVLYNQGFSEPTTTVALQSSLNPSVYGQLVTFTANVTSTSGTPTGNVTFMDGSANLGSATLVNGIASLNASALLAGTHSIVATYNGDANHSPGTSAGLQQVVNKGTTTTTLGSSANPSYLNQSVTFVATVPAQFKGAATGSVTFKQGTATLDTVALTNGKAFYSTTYITLGTRSITATYSGDGNNLGSTSVVLKQVVKALPAATTTLVGYSRSPIFVGQSVTFTAKVFSTYGPIPDGEAVAFSDGTTPLATVPLSGGLASYTTSALKAATHTIKAAYAGDATFKASSGSVKEVVNLYPSSASAPNSSLNPSVYGQPVTLTTTVTSNAPSTPTGTVTFKNGTTTLGSATLNPSGVATLTKANLATGSLSITAVYNGDSETAKSTSPALTQAVNPATTATALISSRNPSAQGQSVKFTATVTSATTTPTGAVTFMDGSSVLGTVNLAAGKASFITSALSTGSHSITAVYNGTTNIAGSAAPVLVQVVN